MANAAIIVTGIKDIDRRLKTLLPRLQKKVIRQGMRAGLKVIAAEVKANAPVDTGRMKKAVQVRAVKSRKRGSIALEVRISGKVAGLIKPGRNPVFYPAIVEYKFRQFMKRAFNSKGEAARQVTINAIRMGIEREAGKK